MMYDGVFGGVRMVMEWLVGKLSIKTSPRGLKDAIEFWLHRVISLRCYFIDHSKSL